LVLLDLLVPTPELVDFVEEDAGGGSLIERALPHVVDIPAQDVSKGRRFFPEDLEVESDEENVRGCHIGAKLVLDDLVEAGCLSHLPRTADHFDEPSGGPQAVCHLPDQGATVAWRGGTAPRDGRDPLAPFFRIGFPTSGSICNSGIDNSYIIWSDGNILIAIKKLDEFI
jgi:hypothetical protein